MGDKGAVIASFGPEDTKISAEGLAPGAPRQAVRAAVDWSHHFGEEV